MLQAITTVALLHLLSIKLMAQEIELGNTSTNKLQPEEKIELELLKLVNQANYRKCAEFIFSARFELDRRCGKIKTLQFSKNLVDTTIISLVRKSLFNTESIWNIKNCKKVNPSLTFLLPIRIVTKIRDCIQLSATEMMEPDALGMRTAIDFLSLITFPQHESTVDSSVYKSVDFRASAIKFVGMTLNPISVGQIDFK
ncbi:hypothetical protein [Flectobacillus longus]|uniref:hypothetical protein n=1 Tax=Flectobacillus longus TaxID=2984207 RepID=UPI0024B72B21|nr:hypothetical protein [Flectobacillus longus]MDI9877796.1 hypothetical protein [Flectobacillus longus]